VDVDLVVQRAGTRTALIVDILAPDGRWRYLEDIAAGVLLTAADVTRAVPSIATADAVLVQLQQPRPAALAAARAGRAADAIVVLDGAPAGDAEELLSAADVVRADDRESVALTGVRLTTVNDAVEAGRRLMRHGPRIVVLAVPDVGNVVVCADGHECLPLVADEVVDTTGAGDAFTAALAASLLRGEPPSTAARHATAAAAVTVGHPGGRPRLAADAMRPYLDRLIEG
jgi:ribokinase